MINTLEDILDSEDLNLENLEYSPDKNFVTFVSDRSIKIYDLESKNEVFRHRYSKGGFSTWEKENYFIFQYIFNEHTYLIYYNCKTTKVNQVDLGSHDIEDIIQLDNSDIFFTKRKYFAPINQAYKVDSKTLKVFEIYKDKEETSIIDYYFDDVLFLHRCSNNFEIRNFDKLLFSIEKHNILTTRIHDDKLYVTTYDNCISELLIYSICSGCLLFSKSFPEYHIKSFDIISFQEINIQLESFTEAEKTYKIYTDSKSSNISLSGVTLEIITFNTLKENLIAIQIRGEKFNELSFSTIVSGYGGFGISQVPKYSPFIKKWIDSGNQYIIVISSGGLEFGVKSYKEGLKEGKLEAAQDLNDVIKKLISKNRVSRGRVGITGHSQGATLAALAIAQDPNLYKSALLSNGVYDLCNLNPYTHERTWFFEYGDQSLKNDISKYCPLELLANSYKIPEILIVQSESDTVVSADHSLKLFKLLKKKKNALVDLVNIHNSYHSDNVGSREYREKLEMRLKFFNDTLKT